MPANAQNVYPLTSVGLPKTTGKDRKKHRPRTAAPAKAFLTTIDFVMVGAEETCRRQARCVRMDRQIRPAGVVLRMRPQRTI